MNTFNLHIEMAKNRFNKTISKIQEIRDYTIQYKGLSQSKIAKLMGKSQSYVNSTINEYNNRENALNMTSGVNYFYNTNIIANSKCAMIIAKMLNDTMTKPELALLSNAELAELYGITYNIASSYRNYVLNGLSKEKYQMLICEN